MLPFLAVVFARFESVEKKIRPSPTEVWSSGFFNAKQEDSLERFAGDKLGDWYGVVYVLCGGEVEKEKEEEKEEEDKVRPCSESNGGK